MQTAQRIIYHYRRRRFILCIVLAVLTLIVTLGLRYVTERSDNRHEIVEYSQRAIASLEKVLEPIEVARKSLVTLPGIPCDMTQYQLREQAARLQTVRSIALVKDGTLYCSSIFGQRDIPINQLQPKLPSVYPLMTLSTAGSLLKGSPILLLWEPSSLDGQSGVMQVVNIELLAGLTLQPRPPLITQAVLNVANQYLVGQTIYDNQLPLARGHAEHRYHSSRYPFAVIATGPSPERVALQSLPAQLPLALMLSLLIGYITWLASATRMSFSWEINLGIAAREFEVFCQPLVRARDRHCIGVEILLRWNNPRQGWISPDVFIPLAEQQDLIAPLTRYVLAETVRQRHLFPASEQFHIGINVAASHFHNGVIIDDLRRVWFANQPKQQLMLELTERDALPDMDYRVVRELHQMGVELAIDDFGTGQSSLAYLERLHPNVLKIDKSFTAAIGTDAVNSTVTDIIIALGKRLRINLVAEGVETEQQEGYLRRHGVAILQGYLYAKPMPIADFPRWLAGDLPPPAINKDRHMSALTLR
ncbi:EAL domain-containing protein [Atlantibacter sp.]|uniref:EAL domain-containing protein n=1 Tax=Atlantibacter sp. TaxID=1903473 RepID=UPI0028B26861|nr:EAL domain-containing protein [Atlantibacter sp.]